MKRQKKRMALLKIMLEGHDDGRSKSYFCRAAALLDATTVRRSIRKVETGRTVEVRDKARALKAFLEEAALRGGIELQGEK